MVFPVFTASLPKRYGLNPKTIIRAAAHILLPLLIGVTVVHPGTAVAQGFSSWWGSTKWWDWSDYRAIAGARIILPRLMGGYVKNGIFNYDITDRRYGVTSDTEVVGEVSGELYVDRLGIRFIGETYTFKGFPNPSSTFTVPITPPAIQNDERIATFQADFSRFGLDLDLVRYPFFKFGIDADWHFSPVQWYDRSLDANTWYNTYYNPGYALDPRGFLYSSDQPPWYQPWTLGIHGQVIPARIRGIPLIGYARFRFPMLFLSSNVPKVAEWEIGGGLRPAIWEVSWLAHSTFSFAIVAGFRSMYLNTNAIAQDPKLVPITPGPYAPGNPIPVWPPPGLANRIELNAHWQGAYFEMAAYF